MVFWDFKSSTYSEPSAKYKGELIQHDQVVQEFGLPPERFITLSLAEQFAREHLKSLFLANGQLKRLDEGKVVQDLSNSLLLPTFPVTPPMVRHESTSLLRTAMFE